MGRFMKIPVGFYGYGPRALDALMVHPDFEVRYFWTPESRLCREVYEAAERYREVLPMEIIRNRTDLLEHVRQVHDVTCFVMNASPIILNEPILEQMDFYNIHPGSLVTNRGHHPHLWSILLDEKESQINLHSVTPEIDLGKVISTVTLPVLPEDTSFSLLNRLEDQIGILLSDLAAYLRGEQKEKGRIEEGGYRRKVTYEDYRINPGQDTVGEIDRKIRARAMHSGAFFEQEGRRYYVDRILNQTEEKEEYPIPCIEERDGFLLLHRMGVTLKFRESKITDMEGTLLWKNPERKDEN